MTQIQPQSTRRLLAVAISAVLSGQALALEAISDEDMSAATGEGIAFLPENIAMVMRSAGTTTANSTGTLTETTASILTDRSLDTGYIRLIPVGPLTQAAINNTVAGNNGKADLFLYGLAVSRADGDANSRLNSTFPYIRSWGSADNPWTLRVDTQLNVPTFQGGNTNTNTGAVSFLSVEAPLFNVGTSLNPQAGLAAETGIDAYNLKLAFWADAFVRRSDVAENMNATGNQFDVTAAGRPNRLRMQMVLDRFSINGSRIQLFQTLGGAGNTRGTNHFGCGAPLTALTCTGKTTGELSSTSAYFNNTLGLAGLLRFNAAPTGVLRLSTAVSSTETGFLQTPAIGTGVLAPTFNANEGLRLEIPRINLVLGSLHQPVIFDANGKNLVLEIARIPKKEIAYRELYTNYAALEAGGDPGIYKGSTCSYYYCGTPRAVAGVSYQGQTASSSSIAIGDTTFQPYTGAAAAFGGRIVPSTGLNPAGVKFTTPTGTVTNLGTAVIDGFMVQHLRIRTTGL